MPAPPAFSVLRARISATLSRWWIAATRFIRTWPLAAGATAIALLAMALGVGLWLKHSSPTMTPLAKKAVPLVRVTARKPVVVKPQPKPPLPSAYQQEQRMTFAQMMKRWNPQIAEAAKRFNVPQPWIRAVMQVESGGRTMLSENEPIKSSMGAMGLMQLMPQTYNDMRVQYRLGDDPYDPHDNIFAGAAYLRQLRDKYGYPAMFAAYNDGPGNLEARMRGEGLLPQETQNYVVHVTAAVAGRSFGGKAAMVKFTRPNGTPATIDAAQVVSIRAAFPGEYAPGVSTVITVGRAHQGVRESLAQVRAAIRAHGGVI